MKRAVILHGTSATPESNWFPWLKSVLEGKGYEVWVPQLPEPKTPNADKWTSFLLSSDWDFEDNLVIGHSAGAVEILNFLSRSASPKIGTGVLVGSFTRALASEPEWAMLSGLFSSSDFDFNAIKQKATSFLFVHGDNDPWCDPLQAQYLADKMDSEYVAVPGGQHFSLGNDPRFTAFPELIEILEARKLV